MKKWAAVAAIVLSTITINVWCLFLRPVGGDYACYGLPAANFVKMGRFAVPQQGPQFELDRLWRFNSPLLGGGPLPFFAIGEIGQDWFLVGCGLELFLSITVFLMLNRLALGPGRWLLASGVTAAFNTTFVYLGEIINQRYTIIAYSLVAFLFYPLARRPLVDWFKWATAGLLPLVHPALLPASVIWALAEVGLVLRKHRPPASIPAGVAFLAGVVLTAYWYLEPHGLKTQFLPHLRSREFTPFSGWQQTLTWKYAIPSQITMALVVLALASAPRAAQGDPIQRSNCLRVIMLASIMLTLDAFGRMFYLSYTIVGLGPVALSLHSTTRWQTRIATACCLTAALQVAVEIKMLPKRLATPVTRAAARDFLIEVTRPGDVIVVGPPFVLSAASDPVLSGAHHIAYIVPMPLYLQDFNAKEFLHAIRRDATVYVGSPEYFDGIQKFYKLKSDPVFDDCDVEQTTFQSTPILIARQRAPGGEPKACGSRSRRRRGDR